MNRTPVVSLCAAVARRWFPVVGLCAVLAACGGDAPAGTTVVDSAGVRITTNPDSPRLFATVDSVALLSIGGRDATGPAQLSQVQGVRLDASGGVWVADGLSAELRIFDADGRHIRTRGGSGDGPGEFRRIRPLGTFGPGLFAVGDRAGDRLAIFDAEGDLARASRLRGDDDRVVVPHRVFADGSVLAQVPTVFAYGSIEPGSIIADTARLVRIVPEDGMATAAPEAAEAPDAPTAAVAPAPVARAAGPLWLWTGRNQVPIPFTANPGLAVRDGRVHLVAGPAFTVRVFEAGRVVERYGVERAVQPVDADDIAAYRAMVAQYMDGAMAEDYLDALDHPLRPDVLPAYVRLLVDDGGRTWAQWHTPDTRWDVYDREGRRLGGVETPAGLVVDDVGEGRLAGVWRDELGVEHVRVYAFSTGAAAPGGR